MRNKSSLVLSTSTNVLTTPEAAADALCWILKERPSVELARQLLAIDKLFPVGTIADAFKSVNEECAGSLFQALSRCSFFVNAEEMLFSLVVFLDSLGYRDWDKSKRLGARGLRFSGNWMDRFNHKILRAYLSRPARRWDEDDSLFPERLISALVSYLRDGAFASPLSIVYSLFFDLYFYNPDLVELIDLENYWNSIESLPKRGIERFANQIIEVAGDEDPGPMLALIPNRVIRVLSDNDECKAVFERYLCTSDLVKGLL